MNEILLHLFTYPIEPSLTMFTRTTLLRNTGVLDCYFSLRQCSCLQSTLPSSGHCSFFSPLGNWSTGYVRVWHRFRGRCSSLVLLMINLWLKIGSLGTWLSALLSSYCKDDSTEKWEVACHEKKKFRFDARKNYGREPFCRFCALSIGCQNGMAFCQRKLGCFQNNKFWFNLYSCVILYSYPNLT